MPEKNLSHAEIVKLWKRLSTRANGDYRQRAADDLEVTYHCVHSWVWRDNIPPEYWPRLIAAVRGRFGIEITAYQLMLAAERRFRSEAAA